MEHNYMSIEQGTLYTQVLLQKDNNLDKNDNLDDLPETPAVYAVCGRVNGQPANPRFIGETGNLRAAIRSHFETTDTNGDVCTQCFKEFMLSIKIKELVYTLLPDSSPEERSSVKKEWEEKYKPNCNKQLNEVH
ncbi:hypothetical protein [Chitinophaga sp. GbtcB8]|uniref:hypothetical protein n=1 Tax=Chitinophaga sp. GbtcB8 TaxID=2824753 RepID=UPI001C2F2AAE|nr:hypothetical protein [Chitinophaga sp. GbtcB8]